MKSFCPVARRKINKEDLLFGVAMLVKNRLVALRESALLLGCITFCRLDVPNNVYDQRASRRSTRSQIIYYLKLWAGWKNKRYLQPLVSRETA
jgi:hypothetical protein